MTTVTRTIPESAFPSGSAPSGPNTFWRPDDIVPLCHRDRSLPTVRLLKGPRSKEAETFREFSDEIEASILYRTFIGWEVTDSRLVQVLTVVRWRPNGVKRPDPL